jgi:carbonic anhydrase/acetyltransferase-like protein (isoleucine patch superfamily)
MTFKILHDNNLPLCFVGLGAMSKSFYSFFCNYRNSIIIGYEEVEQKSKEWLQQYQFIAITSDVRRKIKIVNTLTQSGVHFFSLLHNYSSVSPSFKCGHGTFIGAFNSFDVSDITVGNHAIISTHNTFGHELHIRDFCHIGHHSFLNFADIGQGSVLGSNVNIMQSELNQTVVIPEYCNIMSYSMITNSLPESGTYYKSRKISSDTSLTKRIL